jgi:hypothetical protein
MLAALPALEPPARHETESDSRKACLNASSSYTFNSNLLLTVSPFYHFNRADYIGNYIRTKGEEGPIVPRDQRDSHYAGAQARLPAGRHEREVGHESYRRPERSL